MITQQLRQEGISKGLIRAIAAKAGCQVATPEPDVGIDFWIQAVERNPRGETMPSGPCLGVQVKASTRVRETEEALIYACPVRNYNHLVEPRGQPAVLVLYRMPPNESEWLSCSEAQAEFRHCAYWIALAGQPPSPNAHTRQVTIPRANVFDADALAAMMARIREGGAP